MDERTCMECGRKVAEQARRCGQRCGAERGELGAREVERVAVMAVWGVLLGARAGRGNN
jgi:hypothetical protein